MARENILRQRLETQTEETRVPPLVVQITRQLRHDIFDGRYAPGQHIREQEIADRLGVSRAPVREAFRRLETDGLVETLPWRGVRVVMLSREEIADIFEVAASLMGVAGKLAATRASEDHHKRLGDHVRRLEAHAKNGSRRQSLSEGFKAAALLGEASCSKRVSDMLDKISKLAYWEHQLLLGAPPAYWRKSLTTWREVRRAIRNQDPVVAESAAKAITLHAKARVLEQMDEAAAAKTVAVPPRTPAKRAAAKRRATT